MVANTLLTCADFDYVLRDSRALGLLVPHALLPTFDGLVDMRTATNALKTVTVARVENYGSYTCLRHILRGPDATENVANPQAVGICFWLYASRSNATGKTQRFK